LAQNEEQFWYGELNTSLKQQNPWEELERPSGEYL